MTVILIIALLIIALWLWFKVRKIPKIGTLTLVNGGVKTGKTALSVYFALRLIKRKQFKWHIKCCFIKVFKLFRLKRFRNMEMPEKPLLYSNIPIGRFSYVPLTKALITRQKRFRFDSVLLIDEASLLANSMEFKDQTLNERLTFFVKLIGHETHGGNLVYDTQALKDNHFAFKRCTTNYFFIHHDFKLIPFFVLLWVREERYSDDGATVNAYTEDIEGSLKCIIMPKRVWKQYDRYAFSYLTDDLPVEDSIVYLPKGMSLKADRVVSFINFKTIKNKEDHEK